MAADLGPNAVPDRIAIDAHGYGWRVWDDQETWSMVPQNPDNEPIPEPLTWFVRGDSASPEVERLRDALQRIADVDTAEDSPNSAGWRSALVWATRYAKQALDA
jgi:hypothetical protein